MVDETEQLHRTLPSQDYRMSILIDETGRRGGGGVGGVGIIKHRTRAL